VGLGEDDSLFNLFADDVGGEELSFGSVTCDLPYQTSGAWYFECTVGGSVEAGSLAECWVGVVSADFNATTPLQDAVHACVLNGASGNARVLGTDAVVADMGDWKCGDCMGCLFELTGTGINIWFAKNGQWSHKLEGGVTTAGWKPYIQVAGSTVIELNVGSRSISYPPLSEVVAALGPNVRCQPAIYGMDQSKTAADAWGYHFSVSPQTQLRMQICTQFELVKKIVVESDRGSGAQKLWVWRPQASGRFLPWGDLVTTSEYPPDRTILLDKLQCKQAVATSLVFANNKLDFSVRRLQPPAGYVALGDVVCGASSSGGSIESRVVCVPTWAAKAVEATRQISTFKKCGSSGKETCASLWTADDCLGGFWGSPFERRHTSAAECDPKLGKLENLGVGPNYVLLNASQVRARLEGEWRTEHHVTSLPSLRWTLALLNQLLECTPIRSAVLNAEVFVQIIRYLRSSRSPRPLSALPVLIRMIRLAQQHAIVLPLDDLKPLCKSVLTLALTNYSGKIPLALMKLVDFVVEVQVAGIQGSLMRDRRLAKAGQVLRGGVTAVEESKDEDHGCGAIESKEQEPEPSSTLTEPQPTSEDVEKPLLRRMSSDGDFAEDGPPTAAELQAQIERLYTPPAAKGEVLHQDWWNRPSLPLQLLKLHRGIKQSAVKDLFEKEASINRLRQVLKFLYAIDPTRDLTSGTAVASARSFYPRFMATKLWNEHASTTAFVESQHPYRAQDAVQTVRFPGAELLHVTFDARCALAPGDHLFILHEGEEKKTVFELTSETPESVLGQVLTVPGGGSGQLRFSFVTERDGAGDVGGADVVNDAGAWGWACTVHATGPVYGAADTKISVPEALPPLLATVEQDQKVGGERAAMIEALASNASIMADPAAKLKAELAEMHSGAAGASVQSPVFTTLCQLVCTDGVLFDEGTIGTPCAHSMAMEIRQKSASGAKGSARVIVLEFTPAGSGHENGKFSISGISALLFAVLFYICWVCFVIGKPFRLMVGQKMTLAKLQIPGDRVKYRAFAMEESAFLAGLLAALPNRAVSTAAAGDGSQRSDQEILQTIAALTAELQEANAATATADCIAPEVRPVENDEGEGEGEAEADPVPTVEESDSETDTAPGGLWACEVCTLINPADETACQVCGSPRPTRTGASAGTATSGAAGSTGGTEEPSVGWWCSACTFINALNHTRLGNSTLIAIHLHIKPLTSVQSYPGARCVEPRGMPGRPPRSRRPDMLNPSPRCDPAAYLTVAAAAVTVPAVRMTRTLAMTRNLRIWAGVCSTMMMTRWRLRSRRLRTQGAGRCVCPPAMCSPHVLQRPQS
jgi:hypothetical protein